MPSESEDFEPSNVHVRSVQDTSSATATGSAVLGVPVMTTDLVTVPTPPRRSVTFSVTL